MIKKRQSTYSGKRSPTLADVAKAANVSTAAASLGLSHDPTKRKRVGEQTQNRINEAATDLGYVHNRAASQLRKARSDRVCIVLERLGVPFADQIAQDFETAAAKAGLTSIIVTAENADEWRRVLREVEAGLADAVFAEANSLPFEQIEPLFQPLVDAERPCMIFHQYAAPDGMSVVNFKRADALVMALEHLIAADHRRLAYVCFNKNDAASRRLKALNDFYKSHAPNLEPPLILEGASSRKGGATAVAEILNAQNRPTAIVTESDVSAVAIIHELQRSGFSIPEDFAVIGCGNIEGGQFCHPRLTTIGPKNINFAEQADHLMQRVTNKSAPERFFIEWTFYQRESG